MSSGDTNDGSPFPRCLRETPKNSPPPQKKELNPLVASTTHVFAVKSFKQPISLQCPQTGLCIVCQWGSKMQQELKTEGIMGFLEASRATWTAHPSNETSKETY